VKAVHVCIEGFTASFRHPLLYSGKRISTPMPSYSNLIGLIGACAGRQIAPSETRIAFEFRCRGYDTELEHATRWQYKRGRLIPQVGGLHHHGILIRPRLDLFLSNVEIGHAFLNTKSTPTLGRSQDVAWIKRVGDVELIQESDGDLGPTLAPEGFNVPGLPIRLAEWVENSSFGMLRVIGPLGRYRAMSPYIENGKSRHRVSGPNLFHPSDATEERDVVYLHEWLEGTHGLIS